ncbi:serine/threonine-protein phosphatase 6 regulatory ankyrin repeat subunit A isoform X2 [Strongylocentrotus purpuratus]|uniref:Ankyrin repeat domain-containing protein 10 n=1 Tax=Strongylocentrotus purpuratus TaxID=7668 RepID=A0A7M7SWT2_STRPU|nr:serine/threonine-protein phosphatase 6 regulatory ankyrin repeat subunit A isoform X2 [Strongylocentrotus purpuratus]XP_030837072.1 serine/threonine-protein phosphatase 6 regulatory ankyrin repeat subunit A isoform X2 [Strongylocentrotus purpuratus]
METEFTELSGAEDLLESFPLHRACRDGDLCTLAGLLGEAVVSVCDASAQDPLFGWTPAHWAAHNGKVECLEMLVKAGLPCDIATHGTGLTLAHVAALEGQTACLAWLSKNGISINAQDHMGETAAHKAVRCGSVECLHILNQHGADLSLQSSIGSTVIDLAVQNHQRQCIEYFKAGGDSHLTNHMTCMNGRRKRMQTGEEALLDMDSAKRLKVESDYTLKGELYPGTMDSMRHQDQMMSSDVSGVGSSTVQHHKNGYYSKPHIATGEGSNMSSCRLQGSHSMIASSSDVTTRNMSCSEDAIDQNRLGFAENQLPAKSCGNYSAVPTQPDCSTRDYWMECYVPTPVPKCRALSGHYL